MTQTRVRVLDADTPGIPRDHDRFNMNGPSVLAAPEWMPDRPGNYVMYFAHHGGQSFRLAAADDPTGPWRTVEPTCSTWTAPRRTASPISPRPTSTPTAGAAQEPNWQHNARHPCKTLPILDGL